MNLYKRRVECRGINGIYPVYDNRQEWAREVVSGGVLRSWDSKEMNLGDWVEYYDGKIAEVLIIENRIRSERKGRRKVFFRAVGTVLNMFYLGTTTPITGFYSPYYVNLFLREIDLDRGAKKLVRFVERWLIEGVRFEDALRKLRSEWVIWKRSQTLRNPSDRQLFTFGCWLLTGKWFDRLLNENRIIRDRYMGLIGAFELEGLTTEYFAKKIKEMIDSGSEKERINAINKLSDILITFEKQDRKKFPIFSGSVIEEEALAKSIDNDNLLTEGDTNESQFKVDSAEGDISDKEFFIQKGSKADEGVFVPGGQGLQHIKEEVQTEKVTEQLVEQEIERILGNG